MQRIFTVLTLTCLMLTFFVSDTAHAMPNGDVDVAEKNEASDKRKANTQYFIMLNTNILYGKAKSEYEANEASIERGRIVTSAKLVAATVSFYVSGTLSAPVVLSTLISALDLSESIDASTPLLSAYETTISRRFDEIDEFEILSIAYTNTYDTYIGVLAGHTGWTESYLSTYITNEYNRSKGIRHNGSITPSDKHGIVAKKEWGAYDKTFPAYPCEGPCTDSFMTPTSDHEIKCGGPNDPSSSKVGGCGVRYYSCDTEEKKAIHKPGTCLTQKWHQAWNPGPNGESVPVWVLVDCGEWTRMCFHHTGGHADPADPGNNNFSMVHSTQPIDDDDDSSTEQDTQGLQTEQTQTSTPSYHACGVHETSVSGDHSAAGCGVSGHYVCDGSDHSLQASCTTTNASGQYCTVSSFYACQSHTHVYPAPPAISCGRSGCTQTVSSSTAHQVTCSAGHQYWSCGQYASWHANHHRTCTCRFGRCGQSWQRCSRPSSAPTPMCADPTRTGERCWAKS